MWLTTSTLRRFSTVGPQLLPATASDDSSGWQQTVLAFLAEKERRSGSRRTVEGYARMLWPFLIRVGSPELGDAGPAAHIGTGVGIKRRVRLGYLTGTHGCRLIRGCAGT
jgi:hypothetical protein